MLAFLRRVAIDVSPIRRSRDFRLLVIGEVIGNLGTQAALIALPYQIFVISRSPTLVGLLGAFELGPMVVVSLIGGVLNDRHDRRTLLAIAQVGVIAVASALCLVSLEGHPAVRLVLVLGGLLAVCSALDAVTRSAIVPGMLGPELLRPGLALNYGVFQLMGIVGPAFGGLLIAIAGLATTYAVDALSCVAMLAAAVAISSQPPKAAPRQRVLREVADGLRFVRANRALSGSFGS
ncbi:MAG: MFS transporter [Solirubrobacteraceae bacterium]